MKKEIHPGVLIAAILIVLVVVGFFFYRATTPPATQGMSPLGPGAAKMGDMSSHMTPAEKAMLQGHNANPAGAAGAGH